MNGLPPSPPYATALTAPLPLIVPVEGGPHAYRIGPPTNPALHSQGKERVVCLFAAGLLSPACDAAPPRLGPNRRRHWSPPATAALPLRKVCRRCACGQALGTRRGRGTLVLGVCIHTAAAAALLPPQEGRP
eukprot:CAMPEP_0168384928 /NCGR_PEP_ID=MMETSP0228-20121227/14662_1 /TAXON_ID=133427 /ORGANISM="Protoceratium reticulatum, Strain CCCM 535 (=CCMP 1889)" /LENGTH=131 /DNA_ID=CAMNT_0008398107 /DNA_START=201 /DNA_END=596 /DNA_ORIENTATION=+